MAFVDEPESTELDIFAQSLSKKKAPPKTQPKPKMGLPIDPPVDEPTDPLDQYIPQLREEQKPPVKPDPIPQIIKDIGKGVGKIESAVGMVSLRLREGATRLRGPKDPMRPIKVVPSTIPGAPTKGKIVTKGYTPPRHTVQ